MKPNWRNGVGMLLMLLLLAAWSVAVVALSPWVSQWWWTAQTLFYLAAGTLWVIPIRPLFYWMATGSFRRPRS